MASARSIISINVELDFTLGLVLGGDGEVVVPGKRNLVEMGGTSGFGWPAVRLARRRNHSSGKEEVERQETGTTEGQCDKEC